MEDIKKLLEQNEDFAMSSSEGDDSENEELSIWNLEKPNKKVALLPMHSSVGAKNAVIKRNGEERLPTRRPDPNVYNRNALLARENRRKKKMYLEMIENELQDARKANRALMKALKRQLKVGRRLKQEKKYFQNLIANRSDILSLVSALNMRRLSAESDRLDFSTSSSFGTDTTNSFSGNRANTNTTPTISISSSRYESDQLSIHFDDQSDGSVTVENQNSSTDFSSIDFCTFPDFFTDLEDVNSCSLPNSWDDIWNSNHGYNTGASDDLLAPISHSPLEDTLQTVHDDHCYVSAKTTTTAGHILTPHFESEPVSSSRSESSLDLDVGTEEEFVGICLHNANDKLSVDFCPTCNWNLSSQTPPFQLFNDETLV